MDWIDVALILVSAALILAPPKYDPAILLKEWIERKRKGK
jgi:hypothetical protein